MQSTPVDGPRTGNEMEKLMSEQMNIGIDLAEKADLSDVPGPLTTPHGWDALLPQEPVQRFNLWVWLKNLWATLAVNYCLHVAPVLHRIFW